MFILLLAIIVILFCWAFVNDGLYFPESMYPLFIVVTIILFLYVLYEFIRGNRKKAVFNQYLLVMPIIYFFVLFLSAESVIGTINQIFFWLFYCGFFYLLLLYGNQDSGKSLNLVPVYFACFIFISNYAVLSGVIHVNQFVMILNQHVSGLGERLGSYLQYPNAFAIMLCSLILYLLLYFSTLTEKKIKVLTACLLPGLFALLVMTESRGALVIFTFMWILSWLFIKNEKMLSYLVVSISTVLLGMVVYLVSIVGHSLKISSLGIIVLLLATLCMSFISNFPLRKPFPPYVKGWHLSVAGLMLEMILFLDVYFKGLIYHSLPHALQIRSQMGTGTLAERVLYWKDALNHIGDIFWIGLGGSGWSYFMYRVQTAPYLTSELHNGYLNIFLETGIVGFCYIMGLLVALTYKMIRSKSIYFVPTFALLLGGFVDFSFSYGITILLILLYSALYVSGEKRGSINHKFRSMQTGVLLLLLILCTVKVTGVVNANQLATRAMIENQNVQLIQKAIQLNPWDPKIRLAAVGFQDFSLKEKAGILKEGLKFEPHHAKILFEYADLLYENGSVSQSITYYKKALAYDHFDRNKYERFMDVMDREEQKAVMRRKKNDADFFREEVLSTYQLAKNWESMMNKKVENQRDFHITKKMRALYKKNQKTS